MPNKSNPTVGKSFDTGEVAEAIFCEWVRSQHHLVRKQSPDFFIDYLVEIVASGEPTGRHYATQIKGVAVDKSSTLPRKLALKGKHLRYWVKDCQIPVFVFLIDVVSRAGLWLFIQEYARSHISPAALERQKSFTCSFPPENNLGNQKRFMTALVEAETFVRDLHPGSIQAALAKTRAELQAKEPRFDYSITATEGRQKIDVLPKAPIAIKLEFDKDGSGQVAKTISEAIEMGARLKIPLNKVKMTGSPLFEEWGRMNGNLDLQFGRRLPGQIILSRFNNTRRTPLILDAVAILGSKFATFISLPSDRPLAVRCKLGDTSEPDILGMEMEFIFSLAKWQDLPLFHLPYFQPLFDVLEGIKDGTGVQTEFLIQGVSLAGGHHSDFENPSINQVHALVSWIARCRSVAEHFGVNPRLPKFGGITNEQWEVVEDLAALLRGCKRDVPMPDLIGTWSLKCGSNVIQAGLNDHIPIEIERPDYALFGTPLSTPPVHVTLTNVNVSPLPTKQEGYQVFAIRGTTETHKIVEGFADRPQP